MKDRDYVFRKEDSRIVQEPQEALLGQISTESDGDFKVNLRVYVHLDYISAYDSGTDWFTMNLEVERTLRYAHRITPESFNLIREFQTLREMREFILGLENLIVSAVFHSSPFHDGHLEVMRNHQVMRKLLFLVDRTVDEDWDSEVEGRRQDREELLRRVSSNEETTDDIPF